MRNVSAIDGLFSLVWLGQGHVITGVWVGVNRRWPWTRYLGTRQKGPGLSVQQRASCHRTVDMLFREQGKQSARTSEVTQQNGNYPVVCSFKHNTLCAIKSPTSRIITYLVGALYLQGHLNVKAVWGHTHWLFTVHLR